MSDRVSDRMPPALVVVPARGGSKGIPGKNLKEVAGSSLVARAAAIARSVAEATGGQAVLSTDSEEIADEGRRAGIAVPGLRPDDLASDQATSASAWAHAWRQAEQTFNRRFELGALLEPTSPMRTADDVLDCLSALHSDVRADSALTISRLPSHHAPAKLLTQDGQGVIAPLLSDEEVAGRRRQDAGEHWVVNGLVYAVRRTTLLDEGLVIGAACIGLRVERQLVNIDEPFDLELARWMMERLGEEP